MRKTMGGLAAVAAMLGVAATVQGGVTDRAAYDFKLSAERPSAPSGVSVDVLFKDPEDPEAKPPALDAAVLGLPAGMRIDDKALPRCEASDDDFQMQGRDACPDETRVGEGAVTVMTGVPGADPQTLDIVAFNGRGEIVEVVFFPDTNAVAGIDRVTIEDGRLVAHPPSPPGGPPDGRTAIRELRLDVPRHIGPDGRSYVTTPPECTDGHWISQGRFEFDDGGKTVVESEIPCAAGIHLLPAIDVTVTPKRVHPDRRRTFKIKATSADPSCVEEARIRVGRHRTRTNADGRAQIRARFATPRVRRVKASKPGCRRGRAPRVRVVPRG
jgi:hypothetical protein